MPLRKNIDLSVYVIIEPKLCNDSSLENITSEVIKGGATFLQLRNKVGSPEIIEQQVLAIESVISDLKSDICFVLNDYVELAAKLDMDGVHIGQGDMSAFKARKIIGSNKILGLTAFTKSHYESVDADIVDYVGTGPVYPTLTKPDKQVLGIEGFENLVRYAPAPVVGIGGIDQSNCADVIKAGADGVAMIRSVIRAENPRIVTMNIAEAVRNNK